jgi:pyrroloquinoline quinone (PQQ) biosynthesis protein C
MTETSEGKLAPLDAALERAIARLEDSAFLKHLRDGQHVRPLYEAYLKEAYHFVRMTSSYTPLGARRLDPSKRAFRQWILHHSAHEMGHEDMALNDLVRLGHKRADIVASKPLAGTVAWQHFFYFQVTERPAFAAMGVLFFLEGMAAKLSPVVVGKVLPALEGEAKVAITFVREHGDLDVEHSAELRDMLEQYVTEPEDIAMLVETIEQAGYAKRFLVDVLVENALGQKS